MAQSITQIPLKANEYLVKRTKKQSQKSFWMVGKEQWMNVETDPNSKPDWKFSGIDFIDEFSAMTSGERTVVRMMKDLISWDKDTGCYDHIVSVVEEIPTCEQYGTTYEMFLKSYRKLFQKDFVRRVSKGRYMFNPAFILPSGEHAVWNMKWNEAKKHPNAITYDKPKDK